MLLPAVYLSSFQTGSSISAVPWGGKLTKPPGLSHVRETPEAGADEGQRDSACVLKAPVSLRRLKGLEQLQVGCSQLGILQIQWAVCLEDRTRPLHVHARSFLLCAHVRVSIATVINA